MNLVSILFSLSALVSLAVASPANMTNMLGETANVTLITEATNDLPEPSFDQDQFFVQKQDVLTSISASISNAEPQDIVDFVHNYALYIEKVKSATSSELETYQLEWIYQVRNSSLIKKSAEALSKRSAEPKLGLHLHHHNLRDWFHNVTLECTDKLSKIEHTVLHGQFKKDCKYILKNIKHSLKHNVVLKAVKDVFLTLVGCVLVIVLIVLSPVKLFGLSPEDIVFDIVIRVYSFLSWLF